MADPVSPSSQLSQDQLQDMYLQILQSALDTASATFFATHVHLTPDAQKQIVSTWCERQKREPYRPSITKIGLIRTDSGKETTNGKKKVRGYIDGCYDIMHSGHYNAIRQAKSLCDELIVGVHTNAEIEHHKGPPVMNDEERLAAVKACKWVDQVVFGVPYTPSIALLDELNCDFAVHGDDDATTADGKDAFAEAKAAGRMAIVKRTEGVSTTDLVKRLLTMTKAHHTPTALGLASAQHIDGAPELVLGAAHAPGVTATVATLPSSPQPKSPQASSSTVSSFLPTTWRLSQFANHRVPKQTDKCVYIAGSFDLFHLGHIEKLEAAKKLGNFLYVGIYDDATVNSYKGKNSPVMNIHERVLNVLSCKYVDEVVIGAPFEITQDLLKTLNVSVVARVLPAETSLHRVKHHVPNPCGKVESLGIVQVVQSHSSLSTDAVIQRILDNRARYEQRNANRAKKEETYAAKKVYVAEM